MANKEYNAIVSLAGDVREFMEEVSTSLARKDFTRNQEYVDKINQLIVTIKDLEKRDKSKLAAIVEEYKKIKNHPDKEYETYIKNLNKEKKYQEIIDKEDLAIEHILEWAVNSQGQKRLFGKPSQEKDLRNIKHAIEVTMSYLGKIKFYIEKELKIEKDDDGKLSASIKK